MKRLLRRYPPSITALVVAGAIMLFAVVDHRDKQSQANRAEVGEWYCSNLGVRCNGPSSARIEHRWEKRHTAYVIALVTLAVFAISSDVRQGGLVWRRGSAFVRRGSAFVRKNSS